MGQFELTMNRLSNPFLLHLIFSIYHLPISSECSLSPAFVKDFANHFSADQLKIIIDRRDFQSEQRMIWRLWKSIKCCYMNTIFNTSSIRFSAPTTKTTVNLLLSETNAAVNVVKEVTKFCIKSTNKNGGNLHYRIAKPEVVGILKFGWWRGMT